MNHSKSSLAFEEELVFRVRDFRNGKFQGSLEEKSLRPSGPGMFLDANFTLTLSQWKKGRPNGQTLMFDSAHSVLYGRVVNSVPVGLCCYQLSASAHVYGYLAQNQVKFAVDCPQAGTLVTLSFLFSSWLDLAQSLQSYDYSVWAWDSANNLQRKQQHRLLTNVVSSRYNNQEQKWRKIEQFLQLGVDLQMKDYKQYMRVNFGQVKPDGTQLSMVQTRQEFQVRHKMSSIVCKLWDRQDLPNQFEVKLLGYFNAIDGDMEIQRKYHRVGSSVEESFGEKQFVYDSQQNRPDGCYLHAKHYFQGSLTFTNDIVAVTNLNNLASLFRGVAEYGSQQQMSNHAQSLLEQPVSRQTPISTPKHRENTTKAQKEEELNYLEVVRRDVQEKAERRSRSKRNHLRSDGDGRSFGYEAALSRKMPSPSRFQAEPSSSYQEDSAVSYKHRFSYLEQSDGGENTFRSKSRHKRSTNKYNYVPEQPKVRRRLNLRNLSPHNYEQDDITATRSVYQDDNPNTTNLQQLTQDYARIEDQLKRETSRKGHRHQDYPTPKRSKPQPSYYPSPRSGFGPTPREGSVSPGRSRQFAYVPPSPVATPSRRKWR